MKRFLFLIILLASTNSHAQMEDNPNQKTPIDYKALDFVFSPGLIIQKELFVEANITIGKVVNDRNSKIPVVGLSGVRIGLETNIKGNDNYIIAPKIGLEMSATIVTLRLSAINYFQNKQSEFRILPEFGISIGGSVNLTYGYGISFGSTINGISNHRLGLSFNLNRKLNDGIL